MNSRIQIIAGAFILIGIVCLVNMVRKRKLELRYALIWLILAIAMMIIDLVPGIMNWLSKILGIVSPVNMLFFLGFCFSLAIIFSLTIAISRMSIRIKQLTQQVALFEKRTRDEFDNNKDLKSCNTIDDLRERKQIL